MASKSKRRRKVLGASCILAALIIAGSSFAWFTSKDEVTNRLTATADYGVSVVEDFTPPKDMTPGQEVTKTVAVVNTGNIDALARVAIENQLSITTYGKEDVICTASPTAVYYNNDLTQWSDTAAGSMTQNTDLTGSNFAYKGYKTLITNPTITSAGKWTDDNGADLVKLNRTPSVTATGGVLNPDEVTTLQAGGQLVVAASNSLPVPQQFVQSGDYISTAGLTFGEFNDNGEFLPKETGLYLFRRTVYEGAGNDGKEYSGYYYVAATGDTGGQGTYYALKTKYDTTDPKNPVATAYVDATITEETVGTGSVVSKIENLKVKTTATEDGATAAAKLTYKFGYIGKASSDTNKKPADMTVSSSTASPADDAITFRQNDTTQTYIEVAYTNGDNKEVKFYIELASDWKSNWTFVADASTAGTDIIDHFYLKDDLEAGETSPALIKSVTMNPYANQSNFVDLTYDINVVLDSMQITYDGDNFEVMPGGSKSSNSATPWSNGATGAATLTDKEITSIAWS